MTKFINAEPVTGGHMDHHESTNETRDGVFYIVGTQAKERDIWQLTNKDYLCGSKLILKKDKEITLSNKLSIKNTKTNYKSVFSVFVLLRSTAVLAKFYPFEMNAVEITNYLTKGGSVKLIRFSVKLYYKDKHR